MSNSTQNDHETHTACIGRIKKEGASSTCCYCNPHEGCTIGMKPTQNDWEKRFDEEFPNLRMYYSDGLAPCEDDVKAFIAKELADERKEVITEVKEGLTKLALEYPELQTIMKSILYDGQATLREEGAEK